MSRLTRQKWLALIFAWATILAQWPHDHASHSSEELIPLAGCDDSTPHIAAHHVDGPAAPAVDCPLCSFRNLAGVAPPHFTLSLAPPTDKVVRLDVIERGEPIAHAARCRAPPTGA